MTENDALITTEKLILSYSANKISSRLGLNPQHYMFLANKAMPVSRSAHTLVYMPTDN